MPGGHASWAVVQAEKGRRRGNRTFYEADGLDAAVVEQRRAKTRLHIIEQTTQKLMRNDEHEQRSSSDSSREAWHSDDLRSVALVARALLFETDRIPTL